MNSYDIYFIEYLRIALYSYIRQFLYLLEIDEQKLFYLTPEAKRRTSSSEIPHQTEAQRCYSLRVASTWLTG